MKKFAFFSAFFMLFAFANLSAQKTLCDKICPPGCCSKVCDLSQCTPAQIAAYKAKLNSTDTQNAQATNAATKKSCDITQCTPQQLANCQSKKAKAVKIAATSGCTPQQLANCQSKKAKAVKTATATSGCTPSACRGAKTKFGEAKVISNLRSNLITLKADMEKSKSPSFDERSYDIHGIVGTSDDESLAIIANEVLLIEDAFAKKLNHQASEFTLPENKAKQVQYLSLRINELKKRL